MSEEVEDEEVNASDAVAMALLPEIDKTPTEEDGEQPPQLSATMEEILEL